ncbi:MAG: HAMP domain-containing protein [Gammaproteobacteria bacterium]|nr:HAMP domain-containing protein [Gammaproteobacteria bacterium]
MAFNWTIKTKFLLLIVGLVVFTSLTIVAVVSYHLNSVLRTEKYEQLQQNLSFIRLSVQSDIKQLSNDAKILASSRLVKGLIKSQEGSSTDLLFLIQQEEWLESLRVLFNQVLQANRQYFKVRYIRLSTDEEGLAAHEVIVTWRKNNSIQVLPNSELQNKIHRDYIQQALTLKPDQILLSQLSLNREFGKISQPHIATLRAVAPVFDGNELNGFIVISMNLTQLFYQASEVIDNQHKLYALREDGQYYFHGDPSRSFSFENPESFQYTIQTDYLYSQAILDGSEHSSGLVYQSNTDTEFAMAKQHLHFDTLNPERQLILALVQPYEKITAITSDINQQLIYTAMVIALVTIFLGLATMRTLNRPVKELLRSIKSFGFSQEIISLPVERRDEIGALARQFQEMSRRIKEQTELLNQEILVRRFTEKQLKQQEVELKRSNGELEKFAYVASHDLQEPLRKVQAFGDRLVERSAEQLDERSQDYLKRMQQAASRMSQLINDLLSFSRIATRGRPFKPCQLDDVVSGVLSDLEVAISESGTEVSVQPLGIINGDEMQLRQLLQNLIGNALKFRKPEGQHKVSIWSKLSQDAAFLELHIRDNGIGLDEQYADRIFEVFQRLHARNEYEGTGIGLAICRKIVERHGGSIMVSSALGEGAEFIIKLPNQPHK